MEYSAELGAALGALSNVPGLGAIAGAAGLAYSLLSDEAEPRLRLPHPFAPGGFLWGVPRRRSGARTELGALVTYRVAGERRGGAFTAGQVGAQTVLLARDREHVQDGAGLIGGARASVLGEASADALPLDLGRMSLDQALWSEVLRRGHPEAMAGSWLVLRAAPDSAAPAAPASKGGAAKGFGGKVAPAQAFVLVEILEARSLDGWWSPWTGEHGGKISQALKDELALARARRLATSSPQWSDLDLRPWGEGYLDEWQTAAATLGLEAAGELASWRSPRAGTPAAAARDAWEAERVEIKAAWEARRAQWDAWRHNLEAETARALAVDQAEEAFADAWDIAVSQGFSFEEAAHQALEQLAQRELVPSSLEPVGEASALGGAGASSPATSSSSSSSSSSSRAPLAFLAAAAALVLAMAVLK